MLEMALMAASTGVWISLPFVGWLIFSGRRISDSNPPLLRATLYLLAGVAGWSVIMLVFAAFGLFYPAAFGMLGWALTAAALMMSTFRCRVRSSIRAVTGDLPVLIAILLVVAVWALSPRESIVGGRDMGVYSTHAMYIARHHTLAVGYPWISGSDTTFASLVEPALGFANTGDHLTVQFTKLYPLWLAQGFATAGFEGLIRVNFLFGFAALLVLSAVGRRFLSGKYVLLALAIAALNPGTIWVVRTTLSETLACLLTWGALLSLLLAIQDRHTGLASLAGVVLGLTLTVRIDSYLLFALIFAGHAFIVLATAGREEWQPPIWSAFYKAAGPVFIGAFAYSVLFNRPYLLDLLPQVSKLNLATVGSAGLLLGVLKFKKEGKPLLPFDGRVVFAVGAFISILMLFGLLVRPHWEPFSTGTLPTGEIVRDHREDTVLYLAKYLGYLTVVTAPAGFALLGLVAVRTRTAFLYMPGIVWLGFALLYCYNPSIAPDHFWAIRRFVPVVIPGIALFGMLAVELFMGRFLPRISMPVFALLAIGSIAYLVPRDMILFEARENEGFYEQLARLASKLPDNSLILSDDGTRWGRWETPLMFGFDKKLVPLDFDDSLTEETIGEWMSKELRAGRHVYLLNDGRYRLNGLTYSISDSVNLRRSVIESTLNPIPDSLIIDENFIRYYEVSGLRTDFTGVRLGGRHFWSVRESGFFNELQNPSGARWTGPRAMLSIPVDTTSPPGALRVEVAATGPSGTNVVMFANGVRLDSLHLGPGPWSKLYALANTKKTARLQWMIRCDPFVPASTIKGSGDTRQLGVFLKGVTVVGRYVEYSNGPLPENAHHSSIKVTAENKNTKVFSQSVPLLVTVRNTGLSFWPTQTELGGYRGAVRLGIQWSRVGGGGIALDQRADLPNVMEPGDSVQLHFVLSPFKPDGARIEPGEYEIHIGLLQEGVSWFRQHGDHGYNGRITIRN